MKKTFLFIGIALYVGFSAGYFVGKEEVSSNKVIVPSPSRVPEASPSADLSGTLYTVTRVIDGDTIEISGGQKVRYIGIDAPEKPTSTSAECFAKQALEYNKQLVEGKTIRMEKDVSETDRYGRLLRYVYVREASDSAEIFVNKALVAEGYASAARFPPDVQFASEFSQLQQQATTAGKGLWASCAL